MLLIKAIFLLKHISINDSHIIYIYKYIFIYSYYNINIQLYSFLYVYVKHIYLLILFSCFLFILYTNTRIVPDVAVVAYVTNINIDKIVTIIIPYFAFRHYFLFKISLSSNTKYFSITI